MVRFYKTYLGRLLLGLLILIEIERQGGKTGVAALLQQYRSDDPSKENAVANAVNYYLNGYPDETPSNDEVLSGVFGQLTKKKTDDSDLLDTIVGILRLPYLGGFSSSAVKPLRDAILTPSELSELRKLAKSAAKCSCGHAFESSEMVTVNVSGDGQVSLVCTACVRPSYVRCDYCDTLVPAVRANIKVGNVECGCQKKKKLAEQAQAATPTATLGNHLRTGAGIMLDETAPLTPAQMRILRRGNRVTATTAPPPTPAMANWHIGQPGDNIVFTTPPPDQLLGLDDE